MGNINIIECLLYNYMGVSFVLIKRKRNFVKAPIFFVCQWHCVVKYMCQEYMSDYIMGDFNHARPAYEIIRNIKSKHALKSSHGEIHSPHRASLRS